MVCLCSIYVEFSLFLISKLWFRFKKSNLFRADFFWAKWDLEEEFDAKNSEQKILRYCPFKEDHAAPSPFSLSISLLSHSPFPPPPLFPPLPMLPLLSLPLPPLSLPLFLPSLSPSSSLSLSYSSPPPSPLFLSCQFPSISFPMYVPLCLSPSSTPPMCLPSVSSRPSPLSVTSSLSVSFSLCPPLTLACFPFVSPLCFFLLSTVKAKFRTFMFALP